MARANRPGGRKTVAARTVSSVWQIRDSKPIARLNTCFKIVLDCHDSQVCFNATGLEVGEGS